MRSEKPDSGNSPTQSAGTLLPSSQLRAPLIVVSGPSGVGKTTVVECLLRDPSLRLRRAITATTRKARPNEQDDRDYHFWDHERFQKEINDGHMLEWAQFDHNFYGTPRSEVDQADGKGVVLVIDVQGAARIRELGLEHLSVFIEPPSFEVLETRLRGRGDTSEERILRRLETARTEMARREEFQHRIVNRDLTEAVRELERVIRHASTL
jgi:guanylate kinase